MPNWSSNRLYVKGNPEKVKAFTDTLGTEDSNGQKEGFSFHQTVPMPEFLRASSSGSEGELGYAIITGNVLNPFGNLEQYKERFNALDENEKEEVLEQGRVYVNNIDKCGSANWYDWSVDNWGTKWDACEVDIDVDGIKELVENAIKDKDEEITIDIGFDTAWCPPNEWLRKVAKIFPDLEFQIAFSECGMNFYGIATAQGDDYNEECPELGCTFEEDEENEDWYEPSGDYADFLEYHNIHQGG